MKKTKKKSKNYVTIKMTKTEARSQGLLVCECGWPKNNHFDFGKKQCAHSDKCSGWKEVARIGKLV